MSAASLLASQTARVRGIYRGWWIVFISYLSQLLTAGAGGWIFGAMILPMQRDFGWSQTSITLVLAVNRIVGGLLSAPLGPVVDRYGSRTLMTASAVIAGAGLLAVSASQGALGFYVAWMLYGIATPGIGHLGPRVVIPNWFIRERARAFMWFTMGSATAGIAAVPAAVWVESQYGWRTVWAIVGLGCLALAPLCWLVVRRRPEDVGLLPDGDTPEQHAAAVATAGPGHVEAPWTVGEALHTRAFWLMTLGFLLVSMPSGAIFINISAFVQSFGFSKTDAAWIVSVYGFGVFGGRWVWGFFLARTSLYRTMIAYAAIYATAIVAFSIQSGYAGILLTTIWLGVAVSGGQLLNAQALPDYFGRRIVGALTGYSQLANTLIGASAPLITAIVFDTTGGYVPAFLAFAVFCVIATVAFVFAPPPVHPGDTAG